MGLLSIDEEYERHPDFRGGHLAELFGQVRVAEAGYRREIRKTQYYKAYLVLGSSLRERRRLNDAEALLTEGVARAKRAGDQAFVAYGLEELGSICDARGHALQAERFWRRALGRSGDDAKLMALLAVSNFERQRATAAKRYLEDAVRLSARNIPAQRLVGYALIHWKVDVPRGLRILRKIKRSISSQDSRLALLDDDIQEGEDILRSKRTGAATDPTRKRAAAGPRRRAASERKLS